MVWRGAHPIADGAQKVDFVADQAYEVTPLHPGFADLLNKVAAQGYDRWETGKPQSIFGKSFAPFGLVAGTNFMTGGEYYHAGTAEDLRSVYQNLGTRLQIQTRETELTGLLAMAAAILMVAGSSLSVLWFGRIS